MAEKLEMRVMADQFLTAIEPWLDAKIKYALSPTNTKADELVEAREKTLDILVAGPVPIPGA